MLRLLYALARFSLLAVLRSLRSLFVFLFSLLVVAHDNHSASVLRKLAFRLARKRIVSPIELSSA